MKIIELFFIILQKTVSRNGKSHLKAHLNIFFFVPSSFILPAPMEFPAHSFSLENVFL